MPIDENIKRNIRDIYFDQHKTIRELAKITRKSSRDIVVLLRNSEHKKKAEEKHGKLCNCASNARKCDAQIA